MKYDQVSLTKFFAGANTDARELADILEIDRDHVVSYLYRGTTLPAEEQIAIDAAIRIIKANGWKRKDLWDSYDEWRNDIFMENVKREVKLEKEEDMKAMDEIILILTPCDKRIFEDFHLEEPLCFGGLDKFGRDAAIRRMKKKIEGLMF